MTKTVFRHDLFKKLREEMFASQRKFVDALSERYDIKIRQSHISGIETGASLPSMELFAAFVDILETNPAYLMGRSNDPDPVGNMEDQVVVPVKDPDRREKLQRLAETLAELRSSDFVMILQLTTRLAGVAPDDGDENQEWLELWEAALTMGGIPFAKRLEQKFGVRMPCRIQARINALPGQIGR